MNKQLWNSIIEHNWKQRHQKQHVKQTTGWPGRDQTQQSPTSNGAYQIDRLGKIGKEQETEHRWGDGWKTTEDIVERFVPTVFVYLVFPDPVHFVSDASLNDIYQVSKYLN